MRWNKIGAGLLASMITIAFTIVAIATTDWVWISYLHITLMLLVNCILYEAILMIFSWVHRQRTTE